MRYRRPRFILSMVLPIRQYCRGFGVSFRWLTRAIFCSLERSAEYDRIQREKAR